MGVACMLPWCNELTEFILQPPTPILLPSPCKQHRWKWNGSCGQFITCSLCYSFLFILFLCSSVEVLPIKNNPSGTSPTWILPTGCSFSRTATTWVLSTRFSPQGVQDLLENLILHGLVSTGSRSSQKIFSYVSSSPRGTTHARNLLQPGVSMGFSYLQGISTCFDMVTAVTWHGFTGCRLDIWFFVLLPFNFFLL